MSECTKEDNPECVHEKVKPSVFWDLIVIDITFSDNCCPRLCIRPLIPICHTSTEVEQDTVQVNVLFTKSVLLHESCMTNLLVFVEVCKSWISTHPHRKNNTAWNRLTKYLIAKNKVNAHKFCLKKCQQGGSDLHRPILEARTLKKHRSMKSWLLYANSSILTATMRGRYLDLFATRYPLALQHHIRVRIWRWRCAVCCLLLYPQSFLHLASIPPTFPPLHRAIWNSNNRASSSQSPPSKSATA